MWEYKRECFSVNTNKELNDVLSKIGSENWEIVYYDEIKPKKFGDNIELTIVLKRNKDEQKKSNNNS